MRLLLFGAGGQLGQEITGGAALAANIDLIGPRRAQTDIADRDAVERAFAQAEPDIVVNAAAYTNVDRAESERDEAFRVNSRGAAVVALACSAANVPLIHISTDYVFDGTKPTPYVETDATRPLGVYGDSKLAGEEAVRERHKKHLILRTSWVYGKFGSNFLKTILKLAGERDELKIIADQRGSPTSTGDIANAILALTPRLVARPDTVHWGIYHFTGEGETNWCQFADEILKRREKWVGSRPKLTAITTAEYPTAARRPLNSVLDSRRFQATFGPISKRWQQSVSEIVDSLMAPAAPR